MVNGVTRGRRTHRGVAPSMRSGARVGAAWAMMILYFGAGLTAIISVLLQHWPIESFLTSFANKEGCRLADARETPVEATTSVGGELHQRLMQAAESGTTSERTLAHYVARSEERRVGKECRS